MSTWIITSWIGVALLTIINIVVFLKLKSASEQMLQMAFPGKSMGEAMASMQQMMQGMQGMQGRGGGRGGNPFGGMGGMPRGGAPKGGGNTDAQLKAAMDMLQQMQKKGGKR